MFGLPRKWTRQIAKFLCGVLILSLFVGFTDVYFDFLPSSVQSRLPLHQQGVVVVDIKVESCLTLAGCEKEAKDGWYMIPKDLLLNHSWRKHSFLFVKRVAEENIEDTSHVVLNVAVAESDDAIPREVIDDVSTSTGLTEVNKESIEKEGSWKSKPHRIWIKYGKYATKKGITAVDVLFGPDAIDPRLGWQLKNGTIDGEPSEPRLTVRIGPRQEKPQVELRVKKTGKYKILQAAGK